MENAGKPPIILNGAQALFITLTAAGVDTFFAKFKHLRNAAVLQKGTGLKMYAPFYAGGERNNGSCQRVADMVGRRTLEAVNR